MLNVFMCVVPLSQPSSRDLLYVECLYVLSRYLSPAVEICSVRGGGGGGGGAVEIWITLSVMFMILRFVLEKILFIYLLFQTQ